ncbi:MAG: apolipoprotein N-acyltransferase [Coxiellaceae bacterium]|jgi:apolipoprotein N-acyltransferase|nr:apolipoprotein N-acyltransferase [Coxiellaceae bacterium]
MKLVKNLYASPYLSMIAIFSGAILPLAFAPFGYYLVAEISLLLLLFVWLRAVPGRTFWYGWLFGVAFFGCGIYWVFISIHHYGNAPIFLAGLIVALLVAVLALYPAILGYLLNKFFLENNWSKFLLAFPAGFSILEWFRGWILSGFPWLFLGYSHVNSPLGGWATVFGAYGVSFLIAQTASAIFCMFLFCKNKKFIISLVLLVVLLWIVGLSLTKITWVNQVGEPIQVSLIQGNISQEQKWKRDELMNILNIYSFLTAKNFSSKIIVWPEAAIPAYPEDVWLYLKLLSFVAKRNNATVLSGIPLYDKEKNLTYNGIITLGTNDNGKYYKRHLVPFGEYLPFKFALYWLHKFFTIPMSDFSRGPKKQPDVIVHNVVLAPFICYEIAYSCLVLSYVPKAGMLLTVCDDSWFGKSVASAQHLEIAKMRSLEVGRYQLLATNTGITALINAKGQVIRQAQEFKQLVITEKVLNLTGRTPWVAFGKYLWLPLSLVGLWWAWARRGNKFEV